MADAFCVASGPSLTAADVELVRGWRQAADDRFVIVANASFRIAPWADAMFAMDDKFWLHYGTEIRETFAGKKYCQFTRHAEGLAERVGIKGFMPHGNTGAALLAFCAVHRYENIYMLGYDCGRQKGRSHWHEDHPKRMGNCGSILRWPKQFENVRSYHRSANFINVSRKTSLMTFPRMSLEDALGLVRA